MLALVANVLLARGRDADAQLDRLQALAQRHQGQTWWTSPGVGATHSTGAALDAESTALAALASLRGGRPTQAQSALAWLVAHKGPHGAWRSTQATVFAMRALIAGAQQGPAADARLEVRLDGQSVERLEIPAAERDMLRLLDLGPHLGKPGPHKLEVEGSAGLSVQVVSRVWVPRQAPVARPLSLQVLYDKPQLAVGDEVTATARVQRQGTQPAPMVLLELGLPPGFEPAQADLDRWLTDGLVARVDTAPSQLLVYLTQLEPGSPVALSWRLRARMPLQAQAPASEARLYYSPEIRGHAPPVLLRVE